ncbi:uncharacterized protein LOC124365879 [Homalodisca vitripennis]|uniref:uncharacterized protein LOC124365879 n=1 Tax=Homalodisca vitripennis TaxID=197043 RepID=UPI001EEBC68F|nr:uncharacterized protein LOC124365879 [Homalodisca vitripennis]
MPPIDKKILMRAYRDQLKADKDKYQQHLSNERQRDKERRQLNKRKEKDDEKLLLERRKRVLERVRNHRNKLKLNSAASINDTSLIGSYKCRQSFGKAINRLKKNLPNSPSKKSAVVKKLVLDIGMNLREDLNKSVRLPHRVLSEEHKKCIRNFYCSDTISRQAPGKQDVKSVKCEKTGKRANMQKKAFNYDNKRGV